MDKMQLTFVWRAILEGDCWTDKTGQRRVMSAEELDAVADFAWPWPNLTATFAAVTRMIRSVRRWPPSARVTDAPSVSAEV